MFSHQFIRGPDHIFLQETTDLIHSFALDYPEFITVDSIGKSW